MTVRLGPVVNCAGTRLERHANVPPLSIRDDSLEQLSGRYIFWLQRSGSGFMADQPRGGVFVGEVGSELLTATVGVSGC